MKIKTNDLKLFIKDLPSTEVVAKALTALAYEVEEVYPANQIEGVKVGYTKHCEKHPNADTLSHCKVVLEDGVEHDVVCGGANVATDQKVAWALPGSKVGDITLQPKDLRGITSNGMILSITEIGGFSKDLLPGEEQHDIVVLDKDTPFDANITELLGLDGDVIEISILPDRQYASNIKTLALELSVYLGLELKDDIDLSYTSEGKEQIELELGENAVALSATKIELKEGGKTPQWIKSTLEHAGVKVTDTLEDIMNYASLIYGNSSYIVDSHRITLSENKVNEIDILTTRPEIKSGYIVSVASKFKTNPMSIKELDPFFGLRNARGTVSKYIEENTKLIVALGMKYGFIDMAYDVVTKVDEEVKPLDWNKERIISLIGQDIDINDSVNKLQQLGFELTEHLIKVPAYRRDIEGLQDIVEEILRFYGIDNIDEKEDTTRPKVKPEFHKEIKSKIDTYLTKHKVDEARTYELLTSKESQSYDIWNISHPAKIRKDFNVEYDTVQTSLIQGLIGVYKYNYRKERRDSSAFYEVQNVFHSLEDPHYHLGIIIDSNFDSEKEATLLLKGMLTDIFGEGFTFDAMNENKIFNPYNSANIMLNNNKVGVIGELHPRVLREHKFIRVDKVKTKLFYMEIDLELLQDMNVSSDTKELKEEKDKTSKKRTCILSKLKPNKDKCIFTKIKGLFSK